jgi:hypothetical protein
MIVVPEKVVYIKVPKAASTTIAKLFWARHGVDQFSNLKPDVATAVRHFVPLDKVGEQIPVLNGNWFYNRSGAFGWHAGYDDMMHVFGDQLANFHWVASVRHPVARLFSVFSFQVAKKRIAASLTSGDFETFCEMVFTDSPKLTPQQRIHSWAQTRWLPKGTDGPDLSIVRQEALGADLAALADRIPTFASADVSHINRSFGGEADEYISPTLAQRIEDHYADDMAQLGY